MSHVASAHAIWVEEENQLFLYFHSENSETRCATSRDGINFEYGGVAVTAAGSGPGVLEASYARVFRHSIPGRGNSYLMVFMDAVPGGGLGSRTRRIRLALSSDARNWTVDLEVLITPQGVEGTSLSGPFFLPWQGRNLVIHHASSGDMYAKDVGELFDQEVALGVWYDSSPNPPDLGRSAAPTLYLEGRTLYMFYEAGTRLFATVALATADVRGLVERRERFDCPAEPDRLWPPNGQLTPVSVDLDWRNHVVGPFGFTLYGIEEPGLSGYADNVEGFEFGTPSLTGALRARGARRAYKLDYVARDAHGSIGRCQAVVRVAPPRAAEPPAATD